MFRRLAPPLSAAALLLVGCAEHPLPPWEPPLARTEYQRVRTTAYFDGERDHIPYGRCNALGTTLCTGQINSAAADWGRWPAGTVFQLLQTGQTYVVDDYGWALAGTNTIDLYRPTRAAMDAWGVRRVDIHILQWGDPRASYETLRPRASYRHVARMLGELRPQLAGAAPQPQSPLPAPELEPAPVARVTPVARAMPVARATPVAADSGDSLPQLHAFNSTW